MSLASGSPYSYRGFQCAKRSTAIIRWIGKELGANPVRVFMSGDLGGKRSHAFPLKTIQMHWIEIKTANIYKMSLLYPLKVIKYQVLILKSKSIQLKVSNTLQNA